MSAWEERLLLGIHGLAHPVLDGLARVSHELGTMAFCAVLVVVMTALHLWRAERRAACVWLAVGSASAALQSGLKALVARPRPQLWEHVITHASWAFPSGHALASAALYPLLARFLVQVDPVRRRMWWAAGIGLPVFVGLGRLYLGVHWPSDVLAGWALGAALAFGAHRWLARHGV